MRIADYLSEIQFAVESVLASIWAERVRVDELSAAVQNLIQVVKRNYEKAEAFQDADDPDDFLLGIGLQWHNYFGDDKRLYHMNEELRTIAEKLAIHQFSIAALSGSLLQYAKQAISLVHGQPGVKGMPARCPDGRFIDSQPLKVVIWEGRNQALHWEEGQLNTAGVNCFEALRRERDPKYGDYNRRNMAFDIVELLEWRDFQTFRSDLLLLE